MTQEAPHKDTGRIKAQHKWTALSPWFRRRIFPFQVTLLYWLWKSAFPCIFLCSNNPSLFPISMALFGVQLNKTCPIIHKELCTFENPQSPTEAALWWKVQSTKVFPSPRGSSPRSVFGNLAQLHKGGFQHQRNMCCQNKIRHLLTQDTNP